MLEVGRKTVRNRSNPHKTCAFCTPPQKNRIFPFIFEVSLLRSQFSFAIVQSGPGYLQDKLLLALGAGLNFVEVDRHFRRISRTKWQPSH
jgi:hypothetical protein